MRSAGTHARLLKFPDLRATAAPEVERARSDTKILTTGTSERISLAEFVSPCSKFAFNCGTATFDVRRIRERERERGAGRLDLKPALSPTHHVHCGRGINEVISG